MDDLQQVEDQVIARVDAATISEWKQRRNDLLKELSTLQRNIRIIEKKIWAAGVLTTEV